MLYDYRDAATSDGSAMVLGSDGMPNRVWVLFNEIFDSRNGIRNEETDVAWIVGNRIYDLEGFAIGLEKRSDELFIVGNTIHDVETGIDQFWRETFRLHVFDNVFANLKGPVAINVESQSVAEGSEMGRNLFWQGDDPVRIRWGDAGVAEFASSAQLASFAGGPANEIGDPMFVDAGNHDFTLQPDSPAVDSGGDHPAYDDFESLHGIDIRVDASGTPRPQGAGWDRGAFETVPAAGTGVGENLAALPDGFELRSYPNPFNRRATIRFAVPESMRVALEIIGMRGVTVATLVNERYAAGRHEVTWDGRDTDGQPVASGPYFFQLRTETQVMARKMLLLK